MRNILILSFLLLGCNQIYAQFKFSTLLKKSSDNTQPAYHQNSINAMHNIASPPPQPGSNQQTSIWVEAGYVFAMETFFTGMSYLASRRNKWGAPVVGGTDLFFVFAGYENASIKEEPIQKIGHYLVLAGFLTKSFYNFHLHKDHNPETRFWTNFIGYNVLVFSGYYLDSLE